MEGCIGFCCKGNLNPSSRLLSLSSERSTSEILNSLTAHNNLKTKKLKILIRKIESHNTHDRKCRPHIDGDVENIEFQNPILNWRDCSVSMVLWSKQRVEKFLF